MTEKQKWRLEVVREMFHLYFYNLANIEVQIRDHLLFLT